MSNFFFKIQNSIQKLPTRRNLIVFMGIGITLCYFAYNLNKSIASTNDNTIIIEATILEVLAYIFCSGIILVCIFYFSNIVINKLKFKKQAIKIVYKPNSQQLELPSSGIVPNILGFQSIAFLSNNKQAIAQFAITNTGLQPFSGHDQEHLQLKLSGHFNVQSVRVTSADILKMFQISYTIPCQFEIVQPLQSNTLSSIDINDSFFNGEEKNITTAKPNEGDYSKIKQFESGDDIRRIVWKIFAKHQNLMVRLMEMEKAYHSELVIQTFFNADQNIINQNNHKYIAPLLSYYKNNVWSVYQQLKSQKLQLSFDTDLANSTILTDENSIEDKIMKAQWLFSLTPESTSKHTQNIIIIHSAYPIAALQNLIKSKNALFIFIRLSSIFTFQSKLTNTLKRILFQSSKHEIEIQSFQKSTTNKALLQQEDSISQLLQPMQHIIIEA